MKEPLALGLVVWEPNSLCLNVAAKIISYYAKGNRSMFDYYPLITKFSPNFGLAITH